MKQPKEKHVIKILGTDGNAFAIIGNVCVALKKAGADAEYIAQYTTEAMAGNYNNLVKVTRRYVKVK